MFGELRARDVGFGRSVSTLGANFAPDAAIAASVAVYSAFGAVLATSAALPTLARDLP